MSADRPYRLIVAWDRQKKTFVARAPELDLRASAATRTEAIAEVEELIDQRVAEASELGESLPEPAEIREIGDAVSVKLAEPVHRDLLFHARASGLQPEELAAQLLVRGLAALDGARPVRTRGTEGRGEEGQPEANSERPGPPRGPREDRDDGRGRGPRGRREGYRPELDDKANFLEYLRGLEKGGGGQGGGRGRR